LLGHIFELLNKKKDKELERLGWKHTRESRVAFARNYSRDENRISKYENLFIHFHPCYLMNPEFMKEAAKVLILHKTTLL
jgi:hypothetical protein